VEIGARNGGAAWVRQGLAEGARVIVYPPAGVSDGVRVKPRVV
jgi:HlyD family secretion protein